MFGWMLRRLLRPWGVPAAAPTQVGRIDMTLVLGPRLTAAASVMPRLRSISVLTARVEGEDSVNP
jgi:hypothetical protein